MDHFFLHLIYKIKILSTHTRTKQQETTTENPNLQAVVKRLLVLHVFQDSFLSVKPRSISVLKAARKLNLLEGGSGSY